MQNYHAYFIRNVSPFILSVFSSSINDREWNFPQALFGITCIVNLINLSRLGSVFRHGIKKEGSRRYRPTTNQFHTPISVLHSQLWPFGLTPLMHHRLWRERARSL